jgi:hypothetical protein
LVPLHNAAIQDLDDALAKVNAPGAAPVHPRRRADLTLGRFWMAMSRFHLHALGLYGAEIDRFRPAGATDKDHYLFTYVDAIKLSDCLDAYDGRVLTPELEARYASVAALAPQDRHPHTQDNILPIPLNSPDYRARRDLEQVLKNLDPRLRADALDMLEAAKRVMERYAKTPWGWTVYYSVAVTFIWDPVPVGPGRQRRRGDPAPSDPDDPPTTPRDKEPKKDPRPTTPGGGPKPGGPGSTPGGPTTPPGK